MRGAAVSVGAGAVLSGAVGGALGASRRERRARRRQQQRTGARIVIVGAGLAGLSCAYRLGKRGVHAQVFEAREDRLGGRCWTVRGFENDQVAEHGGEFVDTRHVHLRGIADELGLELEDRSTGEPPEDATSPLWLNGRLRERGEVFDGFDRLFKRLKRDYKRVGDYRYDKASRAARQFDEVTVLEWLDDNVHDRLLREAVDIGISGFFGIDSGAMSAINLFEAYVAPYKGADERYHVHGGNDLVVQGMADALDEDAIQLATPLEAMRRRSDGTYALRFGGVPEPVIADRVVLALPFTTLRDVDLSGARLSRKRHEAIEQLGMGTNAKNHFQLETRPYEIGKWSGGMTMDSPARQSSWQSTEGQEGPTSVITIWRGGRSGASYPTDVPHQWAPEPIIDANLAAFERGVPGLTDAYNGLSWLDSWVDDQWVHGSYAGFLPGQYTRYWDYLGKAEDGVHFAGEHTSTHSQGYLNGGVESGLRAAREVLRAVTTRA